jgi:hypothetical protein
MLQKAIQSLRTDVCILDGLEPSTNENLKIIFSGEESQKNYIKKIAFNDKCQEFSMGKKFFFELFYLVMTNQDNCSLAILEYPFPYRIIYQGAKDFYIPLWLRGRVEIPIIATNESLKEDLRRIRKNKLEYLISKKPEDIYDFYHNMYIPTTRNRHQERGIEHGYDEVIQKVTDGKCELLFVIQEGLAIAGILIITDEKAPGLWSTGIRNGEQIYFKSRATAATYYFSSKYLKEKGFEEMGMGWTRSFLNDGVLQFKKKFNQRLIGSTRKGFIFKFLSSSKGLKGFLINNPFIYKRNNQFIGGVFMADDKQLFSDDFEKFKKLYDMNGLADLTFFQFNDSDGIFSELPTTDISHK